MEERISDYYSDNFREGGLSKVKINVVAVSIFLLAIAIVLNGWLISSKLHVEEQQDAEDSSIMTEKQLLTQSELGKYLGITEEELEKVMPKTSNGVTTSSIPYILIGERYYFPVKGVDRWLTETEVESFW